MSDENKLNRLDRIETKLDNVAETLVKQECNLSRLTDTVEYHVARTNALEDQLKPLQKQYIIIDWVMKIVGLLIAGGLVSTIIMLLLHKG